MERIIKFIRRHKAIFIDSAILFGLMILFFMRWIFQEPYALFTSDVVQHFAMHHFAATAWRLGEIPLWDPYFTWAIAGYLASGFFYPLNFLMDLAQALYPDNLNYGYLLMKGNAFFHYFLASFFMYLLVRKFGISRLASLVAGIIFAYSGFLVKEYVHIQYLQGTTWFPLVFLFFYKSVFEAKFSFREGIKYSILAGTIFGISLLAGQTQPAIYIIFTLLLLVFYSLFYFYQNREGSYTRPLFSFLIFGFVSFGLFAIQFFPTQEYAQYTPRNEMTYAGSVGYSADPLYFITHPFSPTFWGSMSSEFWNGMDETKLDNVPKTKWLDLIFGGLPNEMNFYLGLLPFLLLPFAFFTKHKFLRNFLLILLFCSVLLMLSRSISVIGQLFYNIMGGAARVPVRAAVLWTFSFAFLSAFGLQAILDLKEEKKEIFKKITSAYFFILAALAFFLLPLLVVLMLSGAGGNKMPYFYFPMVNDFSLFIIYFFIYSLLFAFVIRSKDKLPLIILIVFFIIELFSFHAENSFLARGSPPKDSLAKNSIPETGYLKNDKDFFRVFGLDLTAYANGLFSLGCGIEGNCGFGYRPLIDVYGLIEENTSSLYDLLNVKYFYSTKVATESATLKKIPGLNLYLNKDVFPRAFVVYSYKMFADKEAMFAAMKADKSGEDMKQNVFLYQKVLGLRKSQASPLEGKASIKEYKLRKVTVDVNMRADGFLVLSDVWFPGWKAYIDGKETRIYQAYHALRAIQVPDGQHQVVFSYEPLSFKVGITITLVTILLLGSYFSFLFLFPRKK